MVDKLTLHTVIYPTSEWDLHTYIFTIHTVFRFTTTNNNKIWNEIEVNLVKMKTTTHSFTHKILQIGTNTCRTLVGVIGDGTIYKSIAVINLYCSSHVLLPYGIVCHWVDGLHHLLLNINNLWSHHTKNVDMHVLKHVLLCIH